jgi:hypothetical protein
MISPHMKTHHEITRRARFCRGMSLSKPQRNDLLKRVQDDIDVQRVIREAGHGGSCHIPPKFQTGSHQISHQVYHFLILKLRLKRGKEPEFFFCLNW